MTSSNSILFCWNGPMGLPEFDRIDDDAFEAGFDEAIAVHNAEIGAIAAAAESPTFANTIGALEQAGEALARVSALFWNRAGAHTNDRIQALERKIAPLMARHASEIACNPALFARVDTLYRMRETLGLSQEEARVLERHWKGFVKAGAGLGNDDQAQLAAINEELAALGARFGQNVLNDEKAWALVLDAEADLAGLPGFLRDAMASAAEERGHPGKYAVTLSRSIIEPFLTFSDRRDLREAAFRAWTGRGENGGTTDNRALIADILRLRAQKAALLGYENFAALKLDDTMAKTPEAVNELLDTVWEKAVARAGEEEAELARLIAAAGGNHPVAPWDWRYYAEKLKAERFDFSEEALKPYLSLEKIIEACFAVANRLFGITLSEHPDIVAYHPDVRVFEVTDAAGRRIGVFLGDYFNRPSKRSGAWMSVFRKQHKLPLGNGKCGALPIVYNVMNFAKPPAGKPALLSFDDAQTLFHEFGHALHGLLSDVTYPSVSGTSVSRDFVELPSQLYEHWLTVPEILQEYAVHYRTGEPMPKALIDKVLAARTFDAGFAAVEYTASALVDMACHTAGPAAADDPMAFETAVLRRLEMPKAIVMRHRSPHFLHVFSGDGYAAGYYSYIWSEVLDADAFAAFEDAGGPFDAGMAARLRANIYSTGGSVDPEEAYRGFRGRLPAPDAMLKQRGLA